MKISFLTLFPDMIQSGLSYGVSGQALKKGLFDLELVNPRDFTEDVHKTVDDRPFGGGDGMVLLAEPFERALNSLALSQDALVVHTSPQGEVFTDAISRELSTAQQIVWVCSRYSGLDERWLTKNVDRELSVGDYVTSGGELPALVMTDSLLRHVPMVLGNETSHVQESFALGAPLEAPLYTRPRSWEGMEIPPILFSGDHARIERWRQSTGFVRTWVKRKDWYLESQSPERLLKLKEHLAELLKEVKKTPENWIFAEAPEEILEQVLHAEELWSQRGLSR
ncbi:MAG TPA: tRNA (guanosine(37)-N1)-methyltransferase TrmD [Candidatus Obscuribacterales bacterium]